MLNKAKNHTDQFNTTRQVGACSVEVAILTHYCNSSKILQQDSHLSVYAPARKMAIFRTTVFMAFTAIGRSQIPTCGSSKNLLPSPPRVSEPQAIQ